MDNTEIHYLTYDAEEIYREMLLAYIEAGGDVLYPGDEKEILLRAVQAIIAQGFAGVDNALRMATLRYAIGDYLDIYGEGRNCYRIEAAPAHATIEITFTGDNEVILVAGTPLTADGERIYTLNESIFYTGIQPVVQTQITAAEAGSAGNGLTEGMQMQLITGQSGIESIFVSASATGGKQREDDETYRARIREFGLANITTGSSQSYEAAARNVTSEILDAKAVNQGAGEVGIALLLASDSGASAIIQEVTDALSATEKRPLTDQITVFQATDISYTLNIQYRVDPERVSGIDAEKVVADYKQWQDNTIGRAFNPDKLMAALYSAGAIRVLWGAGSQFNGGNVEYTEISSTQRCKGTITLEVVT